MSAIYALHLEGSNDIRYIGQTSQPVASRLYGHRHATLRGADLPVNRWIRKHGPDRIVATVLEDCPTDELNECEIEWIALFRKQAFDLLNLTDGGSGTRGHKQSEEARARIGAAHKNRYFSPEHRAAISRSKKGQPYKLRGQSAPPQTAIALAKSLHVRWHVNRELTKPECEFCNA